MVSVRQLFGTLLLLFDLRFPYFGAFTITQSSHTQIKDKVLKMCIFDMSDHDVNNLNFRKASQDGRTEISSLNSESQ